MTVAMPSDGGIKSWGADAASNQKTPTAQKREKGGRVFHHPTEVANVPHPPLARDLTVTLTSRKSRLSSSRRRRNLYDNSDSRPPKVTRRDSR